MHPCRHSNKRSLTLWRAGIVIQHHSLGAANAMLVATGPTLDATAWEAQEQLLRMHFLDAFAPFATTAEPLNATGVGNWPTRHRFASIRVHFLSTATFL